MRGFSLCSVFLTPAEAQPLVSPAPARRAVGVATDRQGGRRGGGMAAPPAPPHRYGRAVDARPRDRGGRGWRGSGVGRARGSGGLSRTRADDREPEVAARAEVVYGGTNWSFVVCEGAPNDRDNGEVEHVKRATLCNQNKFSESSRSRCEAATHHLWPRVAV